MLKSFIEFGRGADSVVRYISLDFDNMRYSRAALAIAEDKKIYQDFIQ